MLSEFHSYPLCIPCVYTLARVPLLAPFALPQSLLQPSKGCTQSRLVLGNLHPQPRPLQPMTVGSWYIHTHLPHPQEDNSVVCILHCLPKVSSGIEFQLPTVGARAPLLAAFTPCLTSTISYKIVQVSLLKGITCIRVCFWEKPY